MAQIALDSTALDELNSVETRTLFDTADKLSSLGVGRIVNLPQIIVVGDQSSGKSSVLEAISHVHFPVQGASAPDSQLSWFSAPAVVEV
ncbi:dynamin family protein [Colletotrichum tofieldiae]|nr:dynamin family protein [Colletotrichum tofieldiae]